MESDILSTEINCVKKEQEMANGAEAINAEIVFMNMS